MQVFLSAVGKPPFYQVMVYVYFYVEVGKY